MAFSRNFLTDIAQEKELSPRERDVFLALLGDDKSRPQIAEMLHLSTSAVSTCLTGIYRKFQIAASGPVKESRLKDYLTNRYRRLKPENSEDSSIIDSGELSIDALVREVRSRCCEAILDSYSKIRLPDDTRIDVDLLYVDIYVLEKLSSKRYASISGLLEGVEQREDYERLALGQRQKRLPGQEIVQQFAQLMVLGKLGSGKTTFLRHLAVDCSKGKFFCDRIPVLIELRSIKEGNSFNLLNLIHREFGLAQQEQTQQILNQGKAFILLDGLDEVPSQLRQSVRDQIYGFAKEKQYRKNRFVLTCRTQTIEYIAEYFKPIEVANFDPEQVKTFAHNWFTATPETSGEAEGWTSRFVRKLEENKQIRELAVTPILLTLTCLLFTAQQDLPKKRSELYEKGINLLLKQWDRFREIPRDYQQLSVSYKQKLLSYLAFRKFEQPNNFILFEQDEIQGYIAEHLGIDAEESEALLEAIEAHHGLLIEQAQGIWSFSHLTFQEYFAAKYIVDNPNPEAEFQRLVSHINKPYWREVFLLTAEMLRTADKLLCLVKQRVDAIADEDKLQKLLAWLEQKSSIQAPYKPCAVRAFYLTLTCASTLTLDCKSILALPRTLDYSIPSQRGLSLSGSFSYELHLAYVLLLILSWSIDCVPDLDLCLHQGLAYACYLTCSSYLKQLLQQLKEQLPAVSREKKEFKRWWQANSETWIEQLRAVMIDSCDIGYDWQFSEPQKKRLQQYYYANELLVDCLNSDCYVSREVRQEIEKRLLLPAEIENRRSCTDEGVIGECNKNDEKT